jgi:hypothetical protein
MPSLGHDDQVRPLPLFPPLPQPRFQSGQVREPPIQRLDLATGSDSSRVKVSGFYESVVFLGPLRPHPLGRLDGVQRVDVPCRILGSRRCEQDSGKETGTRAELDDVQALWAGEGGRREALVDVLKGFGRVRRTGAAG